MSKFFPVLLIFLGLLFIYSCQNTDNDVDTKAEQEVKKEVKRVGMVIGLKSDKVEEYKEVHADSHPGVRDLLNKYNMHNFSIFLHQFDNGNYYLFGYYEYTGDDFEADMAALAKEERNIEWLSMTDPMQIPFEGEDGWTIMERVYYNP